MVPHVCIVGADKGGVGKTTIARTLIDYYQMFNISVRAFDTEYPTGILQRFHPEKTQIVNIEESDDQVKVFDNLRVAHVTLIDIRAGMLAKTLAMLSDIGFFAGIREARLSISVVHVIGSNKASFDEIDATAKVVSGAKHHVLLNYITKSKFAGLPESVKDPIRVPQLNDLAADTVDRLGVGFEAYYADKTQSEVLRGYVDHWRKNVYAEYNRVGLCTL